MEILNNDPNAIIKWRLSDVCNFRCPYCIRRPLASEPDKEELQTKEIIRIAKELYRNTNRLVKIDLLGGEPSIYPKLNEILIELTESQVIERVSITTNFEKEIEIPNKDKISITASYHPTQTKYSLEEWIERAAEFKNKVALFKVETVATAEATHLDEFVRLCEEHNLIYQIEEDLNNPNRDGSRCRSNKPNKRYVVTDDNGKVREFSTRNEFLRKHGMEGQVVYTGNKECSRDYDYVYIERNKVFQCHREPIPVSEFHPIPYMHPCFRGITGECTLCGNLTIRTMKELIFI